MGLILAEKPTHVMNLHFRNGVSFVCVLRWVWWSW